MGRASSKNVEGLRGLKTALKAVLHHKPSLIISIFSLLLSFSVSIGFSLILISHSQRQFELSYGKISQTLLAFIQEYQSLIELFAEEVKDDSNTADRWFESFSLLGKRKQDAVISSLWYSQFVPADQKDSFEVMVREKNRTRKEYETYSVRSTKESSNVLAVKYVEPFLLYRSWLGYNLKDNEQLRRSLESVDDSLTVLREPDITSDGLFLSYPVLIFDETNQRARIVGYVHAIFDPENFIQDVISSAKIDSQLNIELLEGASADDKRVVFSQSRTGVTFGLKSRIKRQEVSFGNLTWSLSVSSSPLYGISNWLLCFSILLMIAGIVFNYWLIAVLALARGEVLRLDTKTGRLESKVKTREEQLRTIFDVAPFGLAIVSPQGNCIYQNSTFLELFGRSADYFERHNWYDCVLDSDRVRAMELWIRSSEQMIAFEEQFQFQGSKDAVVLVKCKGSPVLSLGELRGYVCFFTDQSHNSELEQTCLQLSEQVRMHSKKVNRMKDQSERSKKLPQEAEKLRREHDFVDMAIREITPLPNLIRNVVSGLNHFVFGNSNSRAGVRDTEKHEN